MPSIEVGAEVFRNRARNYCPCVRSLTHSPGAVIHSPVEIDAAWPATDRDAHALSSEDAEPVLLIVEGYPLDQAGKQFLG